MAIGLLNSEAAYGAYSYLLITKGKGCMCSVVFGELGRVNDGFKATKKFFSEKIDLDIKNPKNVGGVGNFSINNTFKKVDTLYIGEAAGLQDFLWGFGMKYAFVSGYLAAQSIIDNEDYVRKAEKRFNNKLKSGLVNRFLWEKAGKRNYEFLINKIKNNKSLFGSLYSFHNFNLFQKIIYPIALISMRKKYPNLKL